MVSSRVLCFAFGALALEVLAAGGDGTSCLPSAIPAAERTSLISLADGVVRPVPLQIYILGWTSADIMSNIFHIIATEVEGINATLMGGGSSSIDCLHAMAGCKTPEDFINRGCAASMPQHVDPMVCLEVWNFEGFLAQAEASVPGYRVDDLGYLGYPGLDLMSGLGATQRQAFEQNQAVLEYYKMFNLSHARPWEFFPNIADIDLSRLRFCNQTRLFSTVLAEDYVRFTQDVDGVTQNDQGQMVMKCWDGRWWRSPACRDTPERCVPLITGGNGWEMDVLTQRASYYGIPAAIASTLTWGDYVSLPVEKNTLFYAWEPDTTFIHVDPFNIIFPPHNEDAWAAGDKRTAAAPKLLRKLATLSLEASSPAIYKMLKTATLREKDIKGALLAWKLGGGALSTHDVACDWVKGHESMWRKWIPDQTACTPGKGLVDRSSRHVFQRSDAKTCAWCPAGTMSELLEDEKGFTYVCRPCPPGQSQGMPGQLFCANCSAGMHATGYGTVFCAPCDPGSHAKRPGLEDCELCPVGTTAADEGATYCTPCPAGTAQASAGNTSCTICPEGSFQPWLGAAECQSCQDLVRGSASARRSVSPGECECPPGFFLLPLAAACEDCTAHEGLYCPGGNSPPLQEVGYWTDVLDQSKRTYSVYACRNKKECPSGVLGKCAAGREGKACTFCMRGYYPVSDGSCQKCDSYTAFSVPFVALFCMVAGVVVFAIFRVDVSSQRLSTLTTVITFGQFATALQALGTLKQLSVRLVGPAQFVVSLISLLTLDLDPLRGPCIFWRDDPVVLFSAKLMIVPAVAGTLALLTFTVSWMSRRPMQLDTAYNAVGILCSMFFISITLAVLTPLQCRTNPNGTWSMLSEPGIECFGSRTHWWLVGLATLGTLLYTFAFWAWAAWSTWRYPSLSSTERGMEVLKGRRFFFGRFLPEKYYFGMVLLLRNTIVPLIPVVFAGVPEIQAALMFSVLLVEWGVEVGMWPWRTPYANWSSIIMNILLIMVVGSIGTVVDANMARAERAISWFVSMCSFALLAAALCFVGFAIYTRLMRSRQYGAFLCHHKDQAGALARLVKMELQLCSPTAVFLDADELDSLDSLFEIVRSNTSNLVVLLSGGVLSRVWCAGEISTGYKNKINIVAVDFDSFHFPSSDEMSEVMTMWTQQEWNTLHGFDISRQLVTAAYEHLHDLPVIHSSRSCGRRAMDALALEIVQRCRLPAHRFTSHADPDEGGGAAVHADVLILGAVNNMEVLASCEVLKMMLQRQLHVIVRVARGAEEVQAQAGENPTFVVLLTSGMLEDTELAEALLHVSEAKQDGSSEMVTVLADRKFQFPTAQDYSRLTLEDSGPQLVAVYKELFSSIALPFSPLASEAVLKLEVHELCRRRFANTNSWHQGRALHKPTPVRGFSSG